MEMRGKNGHEERRLTRVLELDPDLGLDLNPSAMSAATAELVAPVAGIDWTTRRGRWGPSRPQGHLGLLVLDGLLLREVELLGTFSAEVLGEGDLLRPWDVDGEFATPIPATVHWTVLAPVEVAILSAGFMRRASRWPDVLARLTGRAVRRAKGLALHDAMTNLKHVETRLLVQFWHLAERWGRVRPETIFIPVPLTHEMLGKLVGATRPSVTTALVDSPCAACSRASPAAGGSCARTPARRSSRCRCRPRRPCRPDRRGGSGAIRPSGR